ncbi:hypothetical protein C1924_14130 [Stenotrophomonas sp. ESTM1D_MKCIP4_1]|uniref:hypothetical protein n=1 Tax=Stenotrophomonas sp. ESTM1D_MKCIP4_1 TaxID=2072414 RepID=UPI000D53F268|nr:hypothetical protein [Stenotrophomonas sp. ESTM1D_MKCIP4_1]AWH54238.1 hypothetical protein C1924_14130 [Stenotrophomonas sp. ESTM1D_MKCIP4_1]
MSSSSCAALLVIVACVVLQALDLSLQLSADRTGACLQQHHQALACLAWTGPVETPAVAG